MHKLEELKEMLCEELEEYGSKEKLDMGGLEIVDKLAHAIKNIDKIMESEYSEGRSYRGSYRGNYGEGSYRGNYGEGSYRGYGEESYRSSYARGRGRNARRDSMGRYARADMKEEIERLMDEAPDEETRMKLERFMQSM
ncbi:MAG: hypothetical protein J6S67_14840 [Methanobrevibacter sp.]|nr:hypothetical protein [Methanobrevibacter sp.]